ncbi:xanthine dehydrogenase, molybdenum binding subunit apoprotein [Geodermatophilus amargosae]|uniref:Xanthine dehydrogenase, molybdenum binding subunit apoprotein n=1 Tax=Geodermatophilus amargosae TaxID=1296565 RepID=A0A1I6X2Q4_9ACTN|nr:xanthine dehydrogenase subunit D [Geodermatophilus amargosae]SFT32563.1 xanthine dehydrogenase, molybdenum binding subunit apoprotein [Geodermatophilus amargosae]
MSTPTRTPSGAPAQMTGAGGRVGDDAQRPDGVLKVRGEFAYSSDLWMEDMLWGVTLRSPHPHARIRSIDVGPALAVPGVYAVLTSDDVPGEKVYGLELADQPVLALDVVRYQGEPVALVAADHPDTARRAAARIVVDYDVWEPVTDARVALGHPTWNQLHDAPAEVTELSRESANLHPHGNLVRHLKVRKGDPEPTADVVVVGEYEVGMQDQAFLGPESGLAVPGEDGGVDLYVATQWLHVDQRQICAALAMPPDKVRLTLAGVGGAFGGREDLSMHVHACLLALHTGKPVKMSYNREESFFGHVHRHPATMRYEHGATRDGDLVYVKATIYFDGGAYASSTPAVVGNGGTMGIGPYVVPNVHVDCYGAYTNNPPCGAMRGFGSVQTAFAYESQMDALAAELGTDPVELRCRNAMEQGSETPTGQVVDSPAPVVELLRRLEAMPLPPDVPTGDDVDLRDMPGGVSNTTHGEGVRRGVGYAVAYKNVAFSEGFDDHSTARVRLEVVGGEAVATVHTAAAEVGQGLVTVEQQIARTELGVDQVTVHPKDTSVGSAGSTSASRQTYVTGGAVKAACEAVRARVLEMARSVVGRPVVDLRLDGGKVVSDLEGVALPLADVLGDEVVEETLEWRHRPTEAVDPETGQGFAHVQYAFSAHRAVVDVDTELGLVKVVEMACTQDVGKAINPQAVVGQIQGGTAQGLGLAVMEEILVRDGRVQNPSFTDYLIPTVLDMPPMRVEILEYADPHAPYGLRGVGEAPNISSGPAVLAAIRQATGLPLTRVPVRPEHLTGT